jgi:hypothetical protein
MVLTEEGFNDTELRIITGLSEKQFGNTRTSLKFIPPKIIRIVGINFVVYSKKKQIYRNQGKLKQSIQGSGIVESPCYDRDQSD